MSSRTNGSYEDLGTKAYYSNLVNKNGRCLQSIRKEQMQEEVW